MPILDIRATIGHIGVRRLENEVEWSHAVDIRTADVYGNPPLFSLDRAILGLVRAPALLDVVIKPERAALLTVAELDPPEELGEANVRWVATFNEEKAADDKLEREASILEAGVTFN